MDIQDTTKLLKRYLVELKYEVTGWDHSVPVEVLTKWIKKVERHVIRPLGEINDHND